VYRHIFVCLKQATKVTKGFTTAKLCNFTGCKFYLTFINQGEPGFAGSFVILLRLLMIQKMRNAVFSLSALLFGLVFFSTEVSAQPGNESSAKNYFIKKERNTGVVFSFDANREELRTIGSYNFEELQKGALGFKWENRNWSYLPDRQETWSYLLEAGPYFGKGDLVDSTGVEVIDAEQKRTGLRGIAQVSYTSRFYFDQKNYTIVDINAWGHYDLFRQKTEGTRIDSNQIIHTYDDKTDQSKLRYGFRAKAGWGIGRLNVVNHYMTASWLLENYYPGRIFSEPEILAIAREIGRIKYSRDARAGHDSEMEWRRLTEFLNKQFLLKSPEKEVSDWELTEFRPRFEGTRAEFGPFFNYFNREPDFVYGGYLKFENHKYCSLKRNRNLSASLSYNGYKRKDWILLETDLGWIFYPNLKTEYGIGLKYIPGMVVDGFDDIGPVRHNFVPYLEYFSQVNAKYRIETALAWRIVSNDQFMMPGPEVSVSVYRSRY
jgi:hypothetical protein